MRALARSKKTAIRESLNPSHGGNRFGSGRKAQLTKTYDVRLVFKTTRGKNSTVLWLPYKDGIRREV